MLRVLVDARLPFRQPLRSPLAWDTLHAIRSDSSAELGGEQQQI